MAGRGERANGRSSAIGWPSRVRVSASSHSIEDVTATVPKFPDSNLAHDEIVSPVRLRNKPSSSVPQEVTVARP